MASAAHRNLRLDSTSMQSFRTLLFLCLNAISFGQSNLATINGIITDPSTREVPSADVRAQSADTGAVRTTRTGVGGQYEISGLTPGEYGVEVRARGFAAATDTLRLEVGQ